MSTDPLVRDLVAMLEATREAERTVFDKMPSAIRSRPLRPGDWSPKDHQAHLTAWKGRQADRYAALRRGEEPSMIASDQETDAINADLHRITSDWRWDEVARAADETHDRLISEIQACDPALIRSTERLIGGTFGNGAYHAVQHFGWLREGGAPVDAEAVGRFIDEMAELVQRGSLPDADRGIALYNTACYAALDGNLDRARSLLPDAFRLNPELVELARTDDDLAALRDELTTLAGQ